MGIPTRLSKLAARLDALPVSPSSLADRAMDAHFARRRARAALDPTWAAIEARRHIPGQAATIFLSEDLTLADAGTQDRIAKIKTPDPHWMPLARRARNWRLVHLLGSLTASHQRVTRGWADTDTFSMDAHVCTILAGMLDYLATDGHLWPDGEFQSPEQWNQTLIDNARALAAYAQGTDPVLLDTWHTLATDPTGDPQAREAARQALDDADAIRTAEAKAALHWVADHLESLWD